MQLSLLRTVGQLREGDQLLEANGQSLVDVSNQRRVRTLSRVYFIRRENAGQWRY